MALPSFFKRKDPKPTPAGDALADEIGPVQVARTRARRRLIGAVVLLAIGVVVFPMLFETQPRPLPSDIPIELPRRDGQPARTAALPRHAPAVTVLPPVSEPAAPAASPAAPPATVQAPAEAAAPTPTPAPVVSTAASEPSVKVDAAKADAARPEPVKAPAPRPEAALPAETRKAEADRARALLEGRSAAVASSPAAAASDARNGRYVVQVGAYTDAATLREVRAKVEKLGLKTYTQTIDTEAGKRTRVRVGPFATRQEAESASGKLKGAGLPGNVLTL